MALTIEQIQTNITNKMDAREIINQIADYIQANPGGSPGGGVESVTAGDASITVGGTATEPTVAAKYLVYDSFGDFPATGITGRVYLALDEGYTFKWNGSAYVGIEFGYFDDNDNNVFAADDGAQGAYFEINILQDNQIVGANKNYNALSEYDSFYEANFAGNHYKEAAKFYHEIISAAPALKTYVYADNENIILDIRSMPGDTVIFGIKVDRIKGYQFVNVQEYDDNAAAISGGLPVGGLYRITGTGDLKIAI